MPSVQEALGLIPSTTKVILLFTFSLKTVPSPFSLIYVDMVNHPFNKYVRCLL